MKHAITPFVLLLAGGALSASVQADSDRSMVRPSPEYVAECGSCHVAFPPGLLPASDWQKIVSGLERHFGSDASLDDKTRGRLTDMLTRHAATRGKYKAGADLRMTTTDWFVREHREVPARTWKEPAVKSAANCAACHRLAAQGDYAERNIQLPGSKTGTARTRHEQEGY